MKAANRKEIRIAQYMLSIVGGTELNYMRNNAMITQNKPAIIESSWDSGAL